MPRVRSDKAHKTRSPTPTDNALYTYDLLISLKGLADRHKQTRLAGLIETAAIEAQALAKQVEAKVC